MLSFVRNFYVPVRLVRTCGVEAVSAKAALYRFDSDTGHNAPQNWALERLLAASLVVAIPVGFAYPTSSLLNNVAAGLIIAHSHLGMEQVILDYLHYRPKFLYKSAMYLLYASSIVALAGLLYFNYTNIGLFGALRSLWSLHYKK